MNLLHIEDNPNDAELVAALLADEWPDCTIRVISNRPDLVHRLGNERYDIILSDFSLGAFDGMEALRVANRMAPDTPFIFLSGTIGEDRAIEAVKSGAHDYVIKDRMKRLVTAIQRALREAEERRDKRAAEQAQHRFASILELTPNFVGMATPGGRIFYVNRAGLQMIGAAPTQDPGVFTVADFHPPADSERILQEGFPTAMREGSWIGETTLLTRDGRSIPVSQIIISHPDPAGGAGFVSTIMHDLSAHKKAEQHIREQVDLLDRAHEAIITTDLVDRVTFWNKGAERMSGWKSSETLGKTLGEIFGPGTNEEIQRGHRTLDGADEWRGEIHFQNLSGAVVTMELSSTLVRDDAGKPKARLGIGTDISDKKRLEEQFLRAQRLESIGMLAAGIAHDLNNILAPILLAAPMLRERVTDPGDVSILASLEKSAERGTALVRQILGFAHGTGGEHRLIQAKHLLRDIGSVVTETFPKNIRLEEQIPNELWPMRGNPTHVHQVLLNLCVNARDALPNGGRLRLRAENVVLDEAASRDIEGGRPGAFVVLQVEDTGTGIPPEVLDRIWEPFFTTKEAGKGTGLGLPTVRGIVESHQGFLSIKTEVGRGTAFRVYFPAADAEGENIPRESVHPFAIRGHGELVLVVDDEAHIRDVTAATLAHYGYRVLSASDGTEAVALFAQRSAEISIVVTDLSMPNLDGAALSTVVRHMKPDVKILAVSGLSTAGRSAQALQFAGAFLLKPFKAETLLQNVHRLLHEKDVPNRN